MQLGGQDLMETQVDPDSALILMKVPWFNETKNKDGGQRSRRQLAKQKTNIARQIHGRHGENMHHAQGATGWGGGILIADLMNPRSKMKVGTCLGQSAIATTACCSGRSRRWPGDSVTAAREPISVERGSGAPDGAQKPSINQCTAQPEGLALNQPAHNTKGR